MKPRLRLALPLLLLLLLPTLRRPAPHNAAVLAVVAVAVVHSATASIVVAVLPLCARQYRHLQ